MPDTLHRMLAGLGHEVSAVGVARLYRGLVDLFAVDTSDACEPDVGLGGVVVPCAVSIVQVTSVSPGMHEGVGGAEVTVRLALGARFVSMLPPLTKRWFVVFVSV